MKNQSWRVPEKVYFVKLASFALAILLAACPALLAESPRSATRRGIKEYKGGEFDKALADFMSAREKLPDSPLPDYNLGTALYKLENYPGAVSAFGRAAEKLEPEAAARAWYNLGNALVKGNKLKEAVEAYKNSLKLNHRDEDAKANLEAALRLMQMPPQQQQQSQSGESGDTTQQQQQAQQQEEQRQPQEEGTEPQSAQAQEAQDSQDEQQQLNPGAKMSREEAMQLLKAMEADELEAQKEKLKREFGQPKKAGKDW